MGSGQDRFSLLLLDTGTAERKGEFLAIAHGEDRVEQASGGKNVHGGEAEIRDKYNVSWSYKAGIKFQLNEIGKQKTCSLLYKWSSGRQQRTMQQTHPANFVGF